MIEERQGTTYNGYAAIGVLLLLTLATPVAIGILPMMLKFPMALFGLLVFACWLGFLWWRRIRVGYFSCSAGT